MTHEKKNALDVNKNHNEPNIKQKMGSGLSQELLAESQIETACTPMHEVECDTMLCNSLSNLFCGPKHRMFGFPFKSIVSFWLLFFTHVRTILSSIPQMQTTEHCFFQLPLSKHEKMMASSCTANVTSKKLHTPSPHSFPHCHKMIAGFFELLPPHCF